MCHQCFTLKLNESCVHSHHPFHKHIAHCHLSVYCCLDPLMVIEVELWLPCVLYRTELMSIHLCAYHLSCNMLLGPGNKDMPAIFIWETKVGGGGVVESKREEWETGTWTKSTLIVPTYLTYFTPDFASIVTYRPPDYINCCLWVSVCFKKKKTWPHSFSLWLALLRSSYPRSPKNL